VEGSLPQERRQDLGPKDGDRKDRNGKGRTLGLTGFREKKAKEGNWVGKNTHSPGQVAKNRAPEFLISRTSGMGDTMKEGHVVKEKGEGKGVNVLF